MLNVSQFFLVKSSPNQNPWLHRFAVLTALATLGLIGLGGLVTSKEAGMSVPDWPTSYGYNMFALPFKFWTGGVFYEHTHRLWASTVGLLVVVLARWLGGRPSRLPLGIIGLVEIAAGGFIKWRWPDLKGTGYFLTGIGGVVVLAALVWARNEPASRTLRRLGWCAFGLVQFQGLLGGLRVVLFKDQIGIVHAALAQLFFLLVCAIALLTSRWWNEQFKIQNSKFKIQTLRHLFLFTAILIFLQLLLGATMRHQHAGLAISDFPLAHGQLWPDTSADAVAHYNQQRTEISGINPITAFQIQLQMAHRLMAVLILFAVAACAWKAQRWSSRFSVSGAADNLKVELQPRVLARLSLVWLGLILVQACLGAATVLWNKPADIATAHVLVGALSLATGAMLCIISARTLENSGGETSVSPAGEKNSRNEISFAARTSAP